MFRIDGPTAKRGAKPERETNERENVVSLQYHHVPRARYQASSVFYSSENEGRGGKMQVRRTPLGRRLLLMFTEFLDEEISGFCVAKCGYKVEKVRRGTASGIIPGYLTQK